MMMMKQEVLWGVFELRLISGKRALGGLVGLIEGGF